jgi:Na+/phosphate symporter
MDPKFRGQCKECLVKLKATFDRYLERFRKVSEEYEQFTGADKKAADDKIRLMKNKIEQYELKLSENEIFDVVAKHEKLS